MTPERQMVDVEGRSVRVSHLEKVMYPSTGMTKAEVMSYSVGVAPALLAQLKDRPVTRIRWPDGVDGEKFFEKNTPRGAPEWIRRQKLNAAPGADDEVPAVDARGTRWVEPTVVVDTLYLARNPTGRLRQPVVRAVRTDTDADPWEQP